MLITRWEVECTQRYRQDEKFYFMGACWALAQNIKVMSNWIQRNNLDHRKEHEGYFREAIKHQNHNYGSNLNDVAFAPENRRWRFV